MGAGAIDHRVATGRLNVVHRGVYAVGHFAPVALARELAAVLACGAGAGLSHFSAAVLWRLLLDWAGPVHVTQTGSRRAGPEGVVLHRTAALEIVHRHGIPVTTPARTLVDLARTAPQREFERAVEQAQLARLVTGSELAAVLGPRRPGAARLRRALEDEPAFTRSDAERRLLALVKRADIPSPRTNVRVGRHEVDCLWVGCRLVVEVDGFAFHSSRAAFERDRLRDAELQAAGYRVMRVTWRQLTERPEALAARLAVALASPTS